MSSSSIVGVYANMSYPFFISSFYVQVCNILKIVLVLNFNIFVFYLNDFRKNSFI